VNVLSQIWILREFLPFMMESRKGHIVTICSAVGLAGARNLTVYSSTKHAVNGLVDSLQDELWSGEDCDNFRNIHFTTVYPGPIDTSFACNQVNSR